MRLLCLLSVMTAGAVLAADVVNRTYGFYSSLDDLLGRVPANVGIIAGPVHGLRVAESAEGRVIRVRLGRARARVSRDALVYLPAAYFQPSQARRRFPVVELFHGACITYRHRPTEAPDHIPRGPPGSAWLALLSPAGGVGAAASVSSLASSAMPFLNSRIPSPRLRASDGRRLAPNRRASTRITIRYLSSTAILPSSSARERLTRRMRRR